MTALKDDRFRVSDELMTLESALAVIKPGRQEWLRANLETGDDGVSRVTALPSQGSGILTSMVASSGFMEIPGRVTRIEEGDMLDFIPFNEVSR